MKFDDFWNIIDKANAETGLEDRDAMLQHTESQLFKLPSAEIAKWFNIHHLYLDLAENKAVERAASECGLYLSDDSFLYFRGWLLSLGKEAFYTILNNPEKLSDYITSPTADHTRFEAFVYAGHGIYTQKAFLEEYGQEGAQTWRENWLREHPDRGEYGLEWALGNKYSLWEAAEANPLSKEEKEKIRNDLFSQSKNKTIEVIKRNEPLKSIENVFLDMFPERQEDYRNLSIHIYSGYEWGFGMLPAASEAFQNEMKELFTKAGWEYHAPEYSNACPEYTKGSNRLYCHPLEISGPCETGLIPEVCTLVSGAVNCTIKKVEDRGRIYDITDEEYTAALKLLRPEIEADLLYAFSNPNGGSDSSRHENVMMKYRVLTLENHTGMLASTKPYWKYTEDVLKELIERGNIIKRPEAKSFRSWNYMTAPEYRQNETPALSVRIESADAKTIHTAHSRQERNKPAEPER